MARPGRKKRADAERYPGGRIRQPHQRSKAKDVATAQRLIEAARKRMEDPKWATPLGRLVLEEKLTARCMMAGEKWAELVGRYHKLVGAPRPTPAVMERTPGRALEVDPFDEEVARRAKSIERAYRRASAAMVSLADGIKVARVVNDLCVRQMYITHEELVHARQGLAKLAEHFGFARAQS